MSIYLIEQKIETPQGYAWINKDKTKNKEEAFDIMNKWIIKECQTYRVVRLLS